MNDSLKPDIHKHISVCYFPNNDKKLQTIYKLIHQLNNSKIEFDERMQAIGAAFTIDPSMIPDLIAGRKQPKFKGINFCPGCVQIAIITMEDMINSLKDIQQFYDKAEPDEKVFNEQS